MLALKYIQLLSETYGKLSSFICSTIPSVAEKYLLEMFNSGLYSKRLPFSGWISALYSGFVGFGIYVNSVKRHEIHLLIMSNND